MERTLKMIKSVFQRHHLDAFSVFLLEEMLDPKRNDIADESRSRLVTYMTIAFYLHVSEQPITVVSVSEKAHFNARTVNLGFKYLADNDYLVPTLTVARHGRGRAYEYSFAPKFVKRVLERHEKLRLKEAN
jgi:hypothetical protein